MPTMPQKVQGMNRLQPVRIACLEFLKKDISALYGFLELNKTLFDHYFFDFTLKEILIIWKQIFLCLHQKR